MRLSAIDVARRQLQTAVALFFADGDPVSIHTLGAAAHEILSRLSTDVDPGKTLWDLAKDNVRPEHWESVYNTLKLPANFFKHAGRSGEALNYGPEQSWFFMLDACWAFKRLTRELVPEFLIFEAWAALTWARDVVSYDGTDTLPRSALERWSRMPPRQFFEEGLVIVMQLPSSKR